MHIKTGANDSQRKAIENIDGISIVDAGAGTGKTYAITQRYLNIVGSGVNPKNIFLVTFSRNAAKNMKDKVIAKAGPENIADIVEAPILNFDSFCFRLVSRYGLNAPKILGIDENLSNFKLISESIVQRRLFTKFFNQFLEINGDKYQKILVSISNTLEIHSLIEQLLSKGIYPTRDGWFLDGEERLIGDLNEYLKYFDYLNEQEIGKKGELKNSYILNKFNSLKKNFSTLPEDFETDKRINPDVAKVAFNDDRKEFLDFLHNVFISYVDYHVKENSLTFSLISMFAFLILHNDENARRQNSFDYIMVDEFQDTNEMQFMLVLLLLRKNNLFVVGDWKQGIYGFRNTTIANIIDFDEKIAEYKKKLNVGFQRVKIDVSNVAKLDFDVNYRSSQKILSFSESSLIAKGSKNESIDVDSINNEIVSLKSNFEFDEFSDIEFLETKDRDSEIDSILQKVLEIVGKKKLRFYDEKKGKYYERFVDFKDIAILSRNRTFGIDIQKRAFELNIPAIYEGGIKLFEEEEAIVILAWLKLLLYKDRKDAWVPILEKENYSYLQIKHILEEKDYPETIIEFRDHLLKNRRIINYIIDEILKRYHYCGPKANSLISILDGVFHSTLMSISDLIVFIEENIENGETYNVEINGSDNSIKIQTIHASKGLEYPIVFIVNCNTSNFPSSVPNTSSLIYNELIGVRLKKIFLEEKEFLFDNWKSSLLMIDLFSEMDEERRLLYVAITRAMNSVYFTAHRPSEFFTFLSNGHSTIIEDINLRKLELSEDCIESSLEIKGDYTSKNRIVSVHDLMKFKNGLKGRGMEFGSSIHKMIFRYVNSLKISNIDDKFKGDFENACRFIETELKGGKLSAEIECQLPVDGVLVRGVIDLVAEFEDRVEVIDWKTDISRENKDEYSKQLSAYYHVLKDIYPDKKIECKIFWTNTGEIEIVEPLEIKKLIN